jgi:hypothetical protein
MKRVQIVETKTKKVVGTYPIVMQGQNYTPTDAQYFAEAWRCAEEDGAVDPSRQGDYSFSFVQ